MISFHPTVRCNCASRFPSSLRVVRRIILVLITLGRFDVFSLPLLLLILQIVLWEQAYPPSFHNGGKLSYIRPVHDAEHDPGGKTVVDYQFEEQTCSEVLPTNKVLKDNWFNFVRLHCLFMARKHNSEFIECSHNSQQQLRYIEYLALGASLSNLISD